MEQMNENVSKILDLLTESCKAMKGKDMDATPVAFTHESEYVFIVHHDTRSPFFGLYRSFAQAQIGAVAFSDRLTDDGEMVKQTFPPNVISPPGQWANRVTGMRISKVYIDQRTH